MELIGDHHVRPTKKQIKTEIIFIPSTISCVWEEAAEYVVTTGAGTDGVVFVCTIFVPHLVQNLLFFCIQQEKKRYQFDCIENDWWLSFNNTLHLVHKNFCNLLYELKKKKNVTRK